MTGKYLVTAVTVPLLIALVWECSAAALPIRSPQGGELAVVGLPASAGVGPAFAGDAADSSDTRRPLTGDAASSSGAQPERTLYYLPPSLRRGGISDGILSFSDDVFFLRVREKPYGTLGAAKSAATRDALLGSLIVSAVIGGVVGALVDENKGLVLTGSALGYFAISFPFSRNQLVTQIREQREVLFDDEWVEPSERGLVLLNGRWADPEREAWTAAAASNTREAYRDYLRSYGGGTHASQALSQLDGLDFRAWRSAVAEDRSESYHAYVMEFPEGRFTRQAGSRVRDRLARHTWRVNVIDVYPANSDSVKAARAVTLELMRSLVSSAVVERGGQVVEAGGSGQIDVRYTEKWDVVSTTTTGDSYTYTESRDVTLVPSDRPGVVPGLPPTLEEERPGAPVRPGEPRIPVTVASKTTVYLPPVTHYEVADTPVVSLDLAFQVDGYGEVLAERRSDLPFPGTSAEAVVAYSAAIMAAFTP